MRGGNKSRGQSQPCQEAAEPAPSPQSSPNLCQAFSTFLWDAEGKAEGAPLAQPLTLVLGYHSALQPCPGQDLPSAQSCRVGSRGASLQLPGTFLHMGKGDVPWQCQDKTIPSASAWNQLLTLGDVLTLTGLHWHCLGTIVTFCGAWCDTALPRDVTQPCPAWCDTALARDVTQPWPAWCDT